MRKHKFGKRLAASCLAVCICFASLFCVSAAAASCYETITIGQRFSSSPDSTRASTCQYELTAADTSSPMPEGSEDGKYTVTLVRKDSADVAVSFTHAGNYEYKLAPLEMPARLHYSYDRSEYTILIQVQNTVDGGLKSAVYIVRDGEKVEEIQYRHRFTPPEPDPTPTPDSVPNPTPTPTPAPQIPSNGTGNPGRPGRPGTLQITNPWGTGTNSAEDDETDPDPSPAVDEQEEGSSIGEGKTPLGGGEGFTDDEESPAPQLNEGANSAGFHVCIWFILFLIALAALILFIILWAKKRRRNDRCPHCSYDYSHGEHRQKHSEFCCKLPGR